MRKKRLLAMLAIGEGSRGELASELGSAVLLLESARVYARDGRIVIFSVPIPGKMGFQTDIRLRTRRLSRRQQGV